MINKKKHTITHVLFHFLSYSTILIVTTAALAFISIPASAVDERTVNDERIEGKLQSTLNG